MDSNPLLEDSPEAWERLVAALGPPTMLVCIGARLGPTMASELTAEDVWQETLLHVWRDRQRVEWRGWPALRRWVLQVAENRIRNASDRLRSGRRGGDRGQTCADDLPPPVASTTPSRIASHAEEARAMRQALDALPDEVREVVRLRLFEEVPVLDVAARLALGESAIKHRLRRGAELFYRSVRQRLSERTR